MDEMVVAEASKSAIQYKRVMRTLRWLDAFHHFNPAFGEASCGSMVDAQSINREISGTML